MLIYEHSIIINIIIVIIIIIHKSLGMDNVLLLFGYSDQMRLKTIGECAHVLCQLPPSQRLWRRRSNEKKGIGKVIKVARENYEGLYTRIN